MPRKALLLVDFQNEWIDRDSDYYVGDISGVIGKVNTLIDFCRSQGFRIIFTRHVEEDGGAFAPDSKNSELMAGLDRKDSDTVITKSRVSPFYRTTLEKDLEGVEEVVIAGILTNLCVRSTVQDAYDRDLDIKVIKDCCVAFDKETQEFTFRDLKATREEIGFLELDEFME